MSDTVTTSRPATTRFHSSRVTRYELAQAWVRQLPLHLNLTNVDTNETFAAEITVTGVYHNANQHVAENESFGRAGGFTQVLHSTKDAARLFNAGAPAVSASIKIGDETHNYRRCELVQMDSKAVGTLDFYLDIAPRD